MPANISGQIPRPNPTCYNLLTRRFHNDLKLYNTTNVLQTKHCTEPKQDSPTGNRMYQHNVCRTTGTTEMKSCFQTCHLILDRFQKPSRFGKVNKKQTLLFGQMSRNEACMVMWIFDVCGRLVFDRQVVTADTDTQCYWVFHYGFLSSSHGNNNILGQLTYGQL